MSKVTEMVHDVIDGLKKPFLNSKGQEVPDPVPLFVELGLEPEDPIEERIRRIVGSQMFATAAEKAGLETIDDANDFDVGGEDEILTGYEAIVMADDHLIENPVEESTPSRS
jgi:hypothetical protein